MKILMKNEHMFHLWVAFNDGWWLSIFVTIHKWLDDTLHYGYYNSKCTN
jgi:hypothetical protein